MTVTIEPHNTTELLAKQMDELRARARAAMQQAVSDTAREMRQFTRGRLSNDIRERVSAGVGVVNGAVFPTDDWAKFVEEGTGLYVTHHSPIRPAAARRRQNPRAALRFSGGQFRRTSRGQRPQRFVERTLQAVQEGVTVTLEQAADTTIELLR